MFSKVLISLILCVTTLQPTLEAILNPKSGVTYSFSGGRFGDNLMAVAHAKWLSMNLGVPLVYRSFPYSEYLQLSIDPSVKKYSDYSSLQQIDLRYNDDYLCFLYCCWIIKPNPILFTLPYFPESYAEYDMDPYLPMEMKINWDDEQFLTELRQIFSPLKSLPAPQLPKDRVTVAIHMRIGGGPDTPGWEKDWPLKAPTEWYYVDALTYLENAIKKPLYVYIFTDYHTPTDIRNRFSQIFQGHNITFACRENGNRHDLNVLEDFYAFQYFDCLIRPDSSYSVIASKIFNFKAIVSPDHFNPKTKVVDRFLMQIGPMEGVPNPIRVVLRKPVTKKK